MKTVGFTGTQKGFTDAQRNTFEYLIKSIKVSQFHSGDCIGCDEQAFKIVQKAHPNVWMVVHPPIKRQKRAFYKPRPNSGKIREPLDCLVRNHNIVEETDLLIATPGEMTEKLRSGTWATIRWAIKKHKTAVIVFPDGTTKLKKTYEDRRRL